MAEWKRTSKKGLAKAVSLLQTYALGYPAIKFRCSSDTGKSPVIFASSGQGDPAITFMEIFGFPSKNFAYLPQAFCDAESFSISGILAKSNSLSRASNDRQFIFVNGRPSDQPPIQRAVNDIYAEKGYVGSPSFVIHIAIADGLFDVNLTPDKRKIKLIPEKQICDSLKRIIVEACFTKIELEPTEKNSQSLFVPKDSSSSQMQSIDLIERSHGYHSDACETMRLPAAIQQETLSIEKSDMLQMRVIGQFNCGFILVSLWKGEEEALYIVDQHAADERYQLETLWANLRPQVQKLLAPVVFSISADDYMFIEDHLEEFAAIGFGIEEGEMERQQHSFRLLHVPQVMGEVLTLQGRFENTDYL